MKTTARVARALAVVGCTAMGMVPAQVAVAEAAEGTMPAVLSAPSATQPVPCHARLDGAQVAEHGVLWECRFGIDDGFWAWEIIGPTGL